MYDAKTLDDIQKRLNKGWKIRTDETQMLINMATELLVRTKVSALAQPDPSPLPYHYVVTVPGGCP